MPELPEHLAEWVEIAAPALGLEADEVPIAELLSLTGVVAHGVVRPAAPVTSFLLGLALGRGTIDSAAAGDARLRELVATWQERGE